MNDYLSRTEKMEDHRNSGSGGRRLGVAPLTVLVFYTVSGGPFGVETSVRSAGNLFTLLGFCFLPLVWSLPEALVCAELGSSLPSAAGSVTWVEKAWGPLAGWMTGFLGWVSGVTDNAVYPVLFLDYLLQVWGGLNGTEGNVEIDPYFRFLIILVTTVGLSYVSWLGLPLVGDISVGTCLFVLSPFVILAVLGLPSCDVRRWLRKPTDDRDVNSPQDGGAILWRPFLNNLFWNLNSFDSVANFSEDSQSPRVFARSLFYGFILVTLGYVIPLAIAMGCSQKPHFEWVDGYLATVAQEVVGPWLGIYVVLAAAVSNLSLFQAEFMTDALQLQGMAERGYLPSLLGTRSRHGTPTYSIAVGAIVICCLGSLSNLDTLVELLNFNYGIELLFEYCSFVKLRYSQSDLERPWKVPLGNEACVVMLVPTVFMTVAVMGFATRGTVAFSMMSCLFGLGIYCVKEKVWTESQPRYGPVESELASSGCQHLGEQ